MYHTRLIDKYLYEWAEKQTRKPLLLRGARQVGKSTAVRHLGEKFEHYIEINFEKQPAYKTPFLSDLSVDRIVPQLAAMYGKPIVAGKTLLFLDEIQSCPEAIMALRYFKEDMPQLHVIAAGSLLEFALQELPTYGVGRIHSMFMYPMTFDEFLMANGEQLLLDYRRQATPTAPLPAPLHEKLTNYLRSYMLVGGMPESVSQWVKQHDYLQCQEIQDDIITSYEDDFSKYKQKADPNLLKLVLHSAAVQMSNKFVYAKVGGGYKTVDIKKAIEMLTLAGILTPVTHTSANGLPLGSEADKKYQKLLLLDTGLTLRLLNMTLGDISEITTHILTASASDLVNKGPLAEQFAGLELLRYQTPNTRHELFYWVRTIKNSLAEVDYIFSHSLQVVPLEVKSGTQGGMKSLWLFMKEKGIPSAIRCSLENFGTLDYIDQDNSHRHVDIYPLYALSQVPLS